jgi:RND family efflux transporter MFP subunit
MLSFPNSDDLESSTGSGSTVGLASTVGSEKTASLFSERLLKCNSQRELIRIIADKIRREKALLECWLVSLKESQPSQLESATPQSPPTQVEFSPATQKSLESIAFFDAEASLLWSTEPALQNCCLNAIEKQQTVMIACAATPNHFVIAFPLESQSKSVVCGLIESGGRDSISRVHTILEQVSERLVMWRMQQALQQKESLSRFASQSLQLVGMMAEKPDMQGAALVLVNRLAEMLGCLRVAVTRLDSTTGKQRLLALSRAAGVNAKSDAMENLLEVSRLSVASPKPIVWSKAQMDQADANDAENRFVPLAESFRAECIVLVPLQTPTQAESQHLGCLVLFGDAQLTERIETACVMRMFGRLIGGQLTLTNAQGRKLKQLMTTRLRESLKSSFVRLVMAGLVLFGVALLVPVQHRIKTDCVLEPVSKRFVAAPFDAKLDHTLVEPGAVVKAGQVVARLDDSEIQIERSSHLAALQRESKRFDHALAGRNIAESQIAKHEMEKIELEIALTEKRLAQMEITSPIDGVIVSGDLKKAEGAPLKVGQTIFEIAPLKKLNVEVLIPESEISLVRAGMRVDLRTDAFPLQEFRGAIKQIHPRSEMRHDRNVFIADFELDNADELLKPGMNGDAKIATSYRMLGWILFHRAWEKLMFSAGL